jgi:hypothetical protein
MFEIVPRLKPQWPPCQFLAKKPPTGLNEKRRLILVRPSPAGFGSTAYSHHIDEAFAA